MPLDATLDVTVGDDVRFEFRVGNDGPDPVDVQFRSSKTADVVVYADQTDDQVWQWSDDKLFAQVIEAKTLDPDQTIDWVFTWENPPAGSYTAVATLKADVEAEARTAFSV